MIEHGFHYYLTSHANLAHVQTHSTMHTTRGLLYVLTTSDEPLRALSAAVHMSVLGLLARRFASGPLAFAQALAAHKLILHGGND